MNTITICNMALAMLGIPNITSFDEGNNNAKLCKAFFPAIRDRVLRDHTWSFATKFYELQTLRDASPDPQFPYAAALPADLIRIVRLADGAAYRRAGKQIFVRNIPAKLIYIARIEDPELFDETFCEALQYAIAAEIGMANTRDAQLINLFRQEYATRLAIARSIDSAENQHVYQSARRSDWLAARRGASIRHPRCIGKTEWVEGTEGKQQPAQ